jgi:hypothetical protein
LIDNVGAVLVELKQKELGLTLGNAVIVAVTLLETGTVTVGAPHEVDVIEILPEVVPEALAATLTYTVVSLIVPETGVKFKVEEYEVPVNEYSKPDTAAKVTLAAKLVPETVIVCACEAKP